MLMAESKRAGYPEALVTAVWVVIQRSRVSNARRSGSWKIARGCCAAAMGHRGKKNRALSPEEVPCWLIIKKKMGVRD